MAQNKADAEAEAVGKLVGLLDGFDKFVEDRRRLEAMGYSMPPHVREMIVNMRGTLLKAGLSAEQIDATPGLELPE
jgi:hypothetical protein